MPDRDYRLYIGIACGVVLLTIVSLAYGCRRVGRTAAEIEKLREAVRSESEQQTATQRERERVWEELRQRFDKDKNGSLNPAEEAAFGRHMEKIKAGKEPSPFPD